MPIEKISIIILITSFLGLLNGLQRYLLPIALISYGWSLKSYGMIYVVQAFAMSIPFILGGFFTDLKGRKSTIILSFIAFTVGVTIFSFVISGDSLLLLIVAQVITTVSFGVTRMALSIQMADETIEGSQRTRSLGLQAGMRNFMGFLGPLGFGFLFEKYDLVFLGFNDFAVGFVVLAVFGLVGVVLSTILPDTEPALILENNLVSLSDIPSNQVVMQKAFAIEEVILGFTSGLIVPFIDYYILTVFMPTDFEWGLLTAVGNIGIAAGAIFASRYAEKFGKSRTVILFNLVVPLLAAGIAFSPSLNLVSVFYVGRITVANLIQPIWESWYFTHISKNLRGRTMSLIQVSRRLARAFGTAAGPIAFAALGPLSFPLGCIFYPVGMAIPYFKERTMSSLQLEDIPSESILT